MKTESTVMYVLRLAGTLFLIGAIVAALLAGVNMVTKPIIDGIKAQKQLDAIAAVLDDADTAVALESFPNESGLVAAVYESETGYAIQVIPVGFDNTITMMVGISKETGEVLGIDVISHTETAGLGAVAAAKTSAGEAFRGQFKGQTESVSVRKDGGVIDALTGATVTSRAICVGVNAAQECAANMG